MSDTRRKARVMLNDARDAHVNPDDYLVGYTALCRAIEQHEAAEQELIDFRQEVSDAVQNYFKPYDIPLVFQSLVTSHPTPKPDPLIEVLRSVGGDDRDYCDYPVYVKEIRAKLDALGFEIREKNDAH